MKDEDISEEPSVAGIAADDPVIEESGKSVLSPRLKKNPDATFTSALKCMCMGPWVFTNACFHPCARTVRGPKRPSWSRRMELLVSSLRAGARAMTESTSHLRLLLDQSIPDFALPKGALRQKGVVSSIQVDWVWPRSLSADWGLRKSKKSVKTGLTDELVVKWSDKHPVILYLHGGAFVLCSSGTHRRLIYTLSIECDSLVLVPNYRRPPEVSIIDAVDDCYSCYRHLISIGVSPTRICLMGDSAGGSLTILTLCRIRDEKTFSLPRCAVTLSPWCNLADPQIEETSLTTKMHKYDYLPYPGIVRFGLIALGSHDPTDASVNPHFADLSGLPPMLIHAGELEVLLNQIEIFVKKIELVNNFIKFKIIQDSIHVGEMFSSEFKPGMAAIREIGEYLKFHI
jgi:monoterpene epsilon-lactone hydrolase